jgi:hypothetical protein
LAVVEVLILQIHNILVKLDLLDLVVVLLGVVLVVLVDHKEMLVVLDLHNLVSMVLVVAAVLVVLDKLEQQLMVDMVV